MKDKKNLGVDVLSHNLNVSFGIDTDYLWHVFALYFFPVSENGISTIIKMAGLKTKLEYWQEKRDV